MERLPELEKSAEQSGALRGISGAFLGAAVGTALWYGLMFFMMDNWDPFGKLTVLAGVLVGWLSSWGYRLFQGLRAPRFARNIVRLSCVLTQPLAVFGMLFLVALTRLAQRGQDLDRDTVWITLSAAWEALFQRQVFGIVVVFIVLALVFSKTGMGGLLKYTDPAWYSDPKRLASLNGGGALYNYLSHWPPVEAEPVPVQFQVGTGLEVSGETVTVSSSLKKSQRFAAGQIAGVIVGPSNGHNVLYDRNNQALAKFAWSMKNANLFTRWLLQRNVPFYDITGAGLSAQEEEPETSKPELPQRFTVRESKVFLVLGAAGCLLFSGLTLAAVWLAGRELATGLLCMAVFLFLLLFCVWMLLAYSRRRLEVDGDTLRYTAALGRKTEFQITQVEQIKTRPLCDGWTLLDRNGQVLARLENHMTNAQQMLAYLNQYLERKNAVQRGGK